MLLHLIKVVDCFELNREEHRLVMCPLLENTSSYVPDLIDLTKDEEARGYWLDCFEHTIETVQVACFALLLCRHVLYLYIDNFESYTYIKYVKQCVSSHSTDETSVQRANEFKQSYLAKLSELKSSPL